MAKNRKLEIFTNGIIKENPILVLVLGTCPTLALSVAAVNGIYMGIAMGFVLVCSNIMISALKRIIPDSVRIPCYITIIATFVTVVQLIIKAYFPELNDILGVYIPLIVVNCVILGRAEMFASKNSIADSAVDGLGMGIGYMLSLTFIGVIREFIGAGTIFGIAITKGVIEPFSIVTMSPGGFFVFGCVIALMNKLTKGKVRNKQSAGCGGCPSAAVCSKAAEGGCDN